VLESPERKERRFKTYFLTATASSAPAGVPPRVVAAEPTALTAGFEARASGEVRRVAWGLAERFPHLEPIEAELTLRAADAAVARRAGVVLLDTRFPIWLAVGEADVQVAVDTELVGGVPASRFRAVRRYLEALGELGYTSVFDHQTGRREALAVTLRNVTGDVARAGGSRRFEQLRRDARGGFLAAAGGITLVDWLFNLFRPERRPWWMSILVGVTVGAVVSALQHRQARRSMSERLQHVRDALLGTTPVPERVVCRAARGYVRATAAGTGVVALLALVSWRVGIAWGALVFAVVAALGVASLVFNRLAWVGLDAHALEGLGWRGRVRIPFTEVEAIREALVLDLLVVRGADRTIRISRRLEGYGRLVDLLWDRVERALRQGVAPGPVRPDADLLAGLRTSLTAARAAVLGGRMPRRRFPPWWSWLGRFPLRAQYGWHPHLLQHGRLVWAYVLVTNPRMFESPREPGLDDGAAFVLYSLEAWAEAGVDALAAIVQRVSARHDETAERLLRGLRDDRPTYNTPLEAALTEGRAVFCTSLMLVRAHLPLAHMRAGWLPLLVDPERCRHAMVLPARYWPARARLAWIGAGDD
jgi:hypothetical protein